RNDYARPLAQTAPGSCTNVSWTYGANSVAFFTNLRTYQYDHPGGALNLTLDYISGTPASPDLDLYLMPQTHSIVKETSSGYVAALSGTLAKSDRLPASFLDEEITLPTLAAGSYLIVVNAVASSGGTTSYRLQLNSGVTTLCPQ
ncbi:MAG: hypothetical protein K2X47_17960, partial [Bdellovibrionales bacterium]|nr:hypothetical protein [Bdellovibrionales bacterium]